MRALVLDGHSRAAVEVIQSLGRRGIPVDVAAEYDKAAGFLSRYTDGRMLQPAVTTDFVEWLNDSVGQEDYALIVPATENSLQAFRNLGESSPLWRKALLPPQNSLEIALSKQRAWLFAADIGISVPQSRLIEQGQSIPPSEGFPVVLKPIYSVVTRGDRTFRFEPAIVRDEAERTRNLVRLLTNTSVQEQQYVDGCGVGVECLYANGEMAWCFVHERLHELPLTGGGSTYRKSVSSDNAIVSSAKLLLDALNWHGVAMVEFKRSSMDSFYLMEINPRLWGSLALAVDSGVDFPWGMWLIATGQTIGPQPRYRIPYYTRYLPGDVDWMKENLKSDHDDPLLMTRPVLRSIVEYLRPLAGMESWDHFRWTDPAIVMGQVKQVVTDNTRSVLVRTKYWWLAGKLRRQHAQSLRTIEQNCRVTGVVLFICYGNICRSPFAHIYAEKILPGWEVLSAGFHEEEGRQSPGHLLTAATELGVDLVTHRSRHLDKLMVERADMIVLMDLKNFESLAEAFPGALSKTVCLGLFAEHPRLEIHDPYLFSADQATEVLRQIMRSVDGIVRFVNNRPQR